VVIHVKIRWAASVPLTAVLLLASVFPAWAGDEHRDDRDHSSDNRHWYDDREEGEDEYWHDDDGDSNGTGGDDPVVIPTGDEQNISAELTGYSWQDNTPPGSAEICCAVLHSKAGGQGTFADPITTAVPGSGSSMETPAGTRLYIERLRRYFIVEDSGATSTGKPRFDLWVGGENHSKSDSDACMNSFTGPAQVTLNPRDGLPVTTGELTTAGGCNL